MKKLALLLAFAVLVTTIAEAQACPDPNNPDCTMTPLKTKSFQAFQVYRAGKPVDTLKVVAVFYEVSDIDTFFVKVSWKGGGPTDPSWKRIAFVLPDNIVAEKSYTLYGKIPDWPN